MHVKIINRSANKLPEYATLGSSGVDLRANLTSPISIAPLERVLVPTGIHIELPIGFEAQVRPRSGLAFKHGVSVLNAPGTIDQDYTGEIKVILINLSNDHFSIHPGDRIAQLVVAKYEKVEWIEVEDLSQSDRGGSGFGSTGMA